MIILTSSKPAFGAAAQPPRQQKVLGIGRDSKHE